MPGSDAVMPCTICGGPARNVGALPGSNLFAGRSRPEIIPGGNLYRCTECSFGFRHPRPDKSVLDAWYEGGLDTNWEWTPTTRTDWMAAARLIAEHRPPVRSVLDVGCFDGVFLAALDAGIARHGIEIMPEAAARAASRGITIVGRDFSALENSEGRYDVITAFDVIEHVEDPLHLLEQFTRVLAPHGRIVISTGNFDAWMWRLMGSRYWYCAIPEHIAFVSPHWFDVMAPHAGLKVATVRTFAHCRESLPRRVFEAAANLTYLVAPRAIAALRKRGYGRVSAQLDPQVQENYPPGWMGARDHLLVTLEHA